jgi:multiple sugar transport system permease protein
MAFAARVVARRATGDGAQKAPGPYRTTPRSEEAMAVVTTGDAQSRATVARPSRRAVLARRWLTPYAFLFPALLALGAVILYPIYFNVRLSLTDTRLRANVLGDFVGLANYERILTDEDFWLALRASANFTIPSVLVSFVLGFAVALLLNEIGKARPIFMALLLIPWVISPVITAYAWRFLFNDEFGLINRLLTDLHLIDRNVAWLARPETAVPAVVVASVWRFVPYMMIMMLAGLQSIPRELYEAAEVDGAGAWSKFRHVTVSELRYIIGVVLMFALIWSFNDFTLPYVMTQGGGSEATRVLPILVYRTAFEALRLGRGAAIAMAILLILLFFSVVYVQRLLREEKVTA